MRMRTKSILGAVHTRTRAITSILTSFLTVTYLSADSLAATSGVAKSPVIGAVTASGHFSLDRSEIWGNATLFDGGKIETGAASSEVALRNGVKIQLASSSSATVSESQLTLTKGTGQVAATEDYQVAAGGLTIRSANGASRVRVAWLAGGAVEVTALSGSARVANRTGLVLASIPAGRHMDFAMQAAIGVVTRTGCLLSKDGRFLIQDQNTQGSTRSQRRQSRHASWQSRYDRRHCQRAPSRACRRHRDCECKHRDVAGNRRLLERSCSAGCADRGHKRRCRHPSESACGSSREHAATGAQRWHVHWSQGRYRRGGRRWWSGRGDRVAGGKKSTSP